MLHNCRNCAGPLDTLKDGCCEYCGTRYEKITYSRPMLPGYVTEWNPAQAQYTALMQANYYQQQQLQAQPSYGIGGLLSGLDIFPKNSR